MACFSEGLEETKTAPIFEWMKVDCVQLKFPHHQRPFFEVDVVHEGSVGFLPLRSVDRHAHSLSVTQSPTHRWMVETVRVGQHLEGAFVVRFERLLSSLNAHALVQGVSHEQPASLNAQCQVNDVLAENFLEHQSFCRLLALRLHLKLEM